MRCIVSHEACEVSQAHGVGRPSRHEQAEGVTGGATSVQQKRSTLLALDAGERFVNNR